MQKHRWHDILAGPSTSRYNRLRRFLFPHLRPRRLRRNLQMRKLLQNLLWQRKRVLRLRRRLGKNKKQNNFNKYMCFLNCFVILNWFWKWVGLVEQWIIGFGNWSNRLYIPEPGIYARSSGYIIPDQSGIYTRSIGYIPDLPGRKYPLHRVCTRLTGYIVPDESGILYPVDRVYTLFWHTRWPRFGDQSGIYPIDRVYIPALTGYVPD